MIFWPTSIPCRPQQSTFVETKQRNVVSFTPEVGPPKYRRRSTASGSLAQAQFKMTRAELETFNAFFEDDTKDGSLPFEWKHPTTDSIETWCFESEPEISEVTRNAYMVSVSLRRLP